MVKTKNGLLIMPEFSEAFLKLMKMEMTVKECLALSTVFEEIDSQIKIVNRTKMAVIEKYCQKDEGGKPVADDKGNAIFDSQEIQHKCLEDISAIMNEDFELHLENKVSISGDIKMSPQEYTFLKDLIEVR